MIGIFVGFGLFSVALGLLIGHLLRELEEADEDIRCLDRDREDRPARRP